MSAANKKILIARPTVGEPELDAVRAVFDSGWLGMGEVTREFERRLAELIGVPHVVGVSSGSAALYLALTALTLEPGDEVVLPSLTHVSCAQAVIAAGATPRFCDVTADTATLDPASVEHALGARTRAIILVHYGGFGSGIDDLVALARDHGLRIVEDAAHALGSHDRGRPLGSIGDLSCLSFDPLKNVTCGEGGAIATGDAVLAKQLRASRNLGIVSDSLERRRSATPWFYEAATAGMRYHLPDVNAAIGLAQLERFDERRARKQAIVRRYREGLAGIDGIEPLAGDIDATFPFLCAARVSDGRRDAVVQSLGALGIQAWVHFVPCHLQPAFSAYSRSLPVTELLYGELVSLPLHADLGDADVDRVLAAVRQALGAVVTDRPPLIVLGTTLFATEIADVATEAGFEVTGYVENLDREKCASDLDGRPVHWIEDCDSLVATHRAVCGLGTTRRSVFTDQAAGVGLRFATVVHPTAHVSRTSTIGEGSIVGVGVVVAAHAEIGRHVLLNRGSMVGHHTRIGDHVSVLPGANIAGACVVGRAAYIGMGSIVIDHLSIGEGSVVGAGAVVVEDVPPNVQVVGIPAKIVKRGVQGR